MPTRNGHKSTEEYKKRAKYWEQGLIENKKKAEGTMYDEDNGGRCCLAVAQDIACARSKKTKEAIEGNEEVDHEMPHIAVARYFGWKSRNPEIGHKSICASEHNDGEQALDDRATLKAKTHKQIAKLIKSEWGI